MIYFTADTHFNHAKVIEYSRRPFRDLDDMTETLIANWNERIKPADLVYHLGDFALTWSRQEAVVESILSRLNGHKFLVKGNHDRDAVYLNKRWVKSVPYMEIKVDIGEPVRRKIVLCHYAMRVWNGSHHGSFMLYGHSHGNLSDVGGKTMDVGVDANNYRPVSLDEVVEFMQGREIHEVDHHKQGMET